MGNVMVSEAQMPLYSDVGDNGQWDTGVGIRNLDKGPAASPVADPVPLAPGHSSRQGSHNQLWLLPGL